ncbi:hypothetical protein [Saccharopolyspora dendranthemae]|uniref:Uncharacterized protein n=1 Tax=Saccharopolyspora dendranthemae TaxID=1181886 RepID=A0A561VAP8_9PSEU|nr:hypothetical protein [Saccharopolyspora dendranthemae]TWG08672.1 hypothetical protein FHU35_111295 [Saccharopolyspora dendranthemae]
MGARIDLAKLAGDTDHQDRPADEPVTARRPLSLPRRLRRRPDPSRTTAH